MAVRTPQLFLERKRVFDPKVLHRARFRMGTQHSHLRSIVHHPDMTGELPVDEGLTIEEERRQPYIDVYDPDYYLNRLW